MLGMAGTTESYWFLREVQFPAVQTKPRLSASVPQAAKINSDGLTLRLTILTLAPLSLNVFLNDLSYLEPN